MSKGIIAIISITILVIIFCTQVTFFVVQPIGAVPEGKTLLMLRINKTKFIDSADAICAREMDGVSLMCRGITMATVVKKGTILMRLPYSEFLYDISTEGKEYSR
ncbi:hypothetical protein [Shewanella fidelis]|uniref:Uncharacterized protein n=1 Tax=Shewanella fidelis TaxID=173509 RepID=A0AAW8NN84_9GAMM|nr:hypothetical protein [Shewanella fidelis]MDR8523398.1 hypothetical protein [Shewanella fidelis]MDW4813368.1 hypothetical protein [Shewanella fidelis]MDW4817260.1 hypothetical protein [Shewanella fidelis]MDW4821383.1 hypothetical protein [Shewanella fidelis]MDW4824539.1 hypothetical protein [Shewanella fidelis]